VCGRFKRKSDKRKVARVFKIQAGLEDADFDPGARSRKAATRGCGQDRATEVGAKTRNAATAWEETSSPKRNFPDGLS
jgi:hypothetical protein